MQRSEPGFHIITAPILVLFLLIIGGIVFRVWQSQNRHLATQATVPNQATNVAKNPASCSDGPLFDHIPMALDDFRAFRPLGFITVPHHIFGAKHSSFTINLPGEHVGGKVVTFPSDATVTNITSIKTAQNSGYQIVFYPCPQFKSYFFHLGTISEHLQQAFAKASPKCQSSTFDGATTITGCNASVSVAVSSGELVGSSDGLGGVDWGAVDYRITANYANPSRYDGDYPHYTSPVLYLTPPLKAKMLAKMGSYDGQVRRTAEPRVGTLAQDLVGTAQGNWFIGDKSYRNTQDFSPFMGLLHDYIDPTQPEFAMGTSVKGLAKGVYSFKVASSGLNNRDFSVVKPDGQVYCYDAWLSGQSNGHLPLNGLNGTILLRMPSDNTLLVEYQSGSCSTAHSLTSVAAAFER